MPTLRILSLTAALLFGLLSFSAATTTGTVDHSFAAGSRIDQPVSAIMPTIDGKVYISGSFTTVRGAQRRGIARLNRDGTVDSSFDPGTGADAPVDCVALQPDGKILLGGSFTRFNGTHCFRIARLNPDGSLDRAFSSQALADRAVSAVTVQPDGKIVITGAFSSVNRQRRFAIARLNRDGSLDEGFDASNVFSFNGRTVSFVAIQADGKLVIGGNFSTVHSPPWDSLARLNADGSLDISFRPDPRPSHYLRSLVLQPDARLLVGAEFTASNGTRVQQLERLNPDGSRDASFTPVPDFTNPVVLQPDGRILACRCFAVDFTCWFQVMRFNPNGTRDSSFNQGRELEMNGVVASATPLPDGGGALLGGAFGIAGNAGRSKLVKLQPDGTVDTEFQPGSEIAGYVWAVANQPDGKSLIAGSFTSVDAVPRRGIARLDSDGTLDRNFNPGSGVEGVVDNMAVQADGKVVLAGPFTAINETPRHGIARMNPNGSLDLAFNPRLGQFSSVRAIEIQPDGKLLIVGEFNEVNGRPRGGIARLNRDGTLDETFNPGPELGRLVRAVTIQTDGRILIAGWIGMIRGLEVRGIARLNPDGSLDTSFNPGIGTEDGPINAIAVQSDGKVIIAGAFSRVNGVTVGCLARLNSDGSLDATYIPNMTAEEDLWSVLLQADGKVLACGAITGANGIPGDGIVRLDRDGSVDPSFEFLTSRYPARYDTSMVMQADGKVIVATLTPTNGVARLLNSPFLSQLVAVSPSKVEWLRGGSAPEVTWVEFEFSVDGLVWVPLGVGNRINGGWERAGLSLPPEGRLRARGRLSGGKNSSLVEQVASYRLGNPEITVSGNGLNIANADATPSAADHTDFGSVAAGGAPVTRTFTIANTGPVSLALTGSPPVTISGSTAFGVTRQPGTATVAPDGSTVTFDVSFSAPSTGTQSATVTIASDDTDENPFTFTVSGTGPSPADAFVHTMTNAGLAGPTATPDATPHGDGVNNLLKYAFNMNLADKDSRTMPPGGTAGLPAITTQPNTPAGILRFEFVRRIGSGLIYTPQKNPNPGNPASWVPLTDTPSVNAIDAAWERVIYEEPYDPTAAPRLFGRVHVTLP